MNTIASKVYQRLTNLTFAFVLAMSSLTALMPFIFSSTAGAVGAAVYDGIPSVQPATYPSLGYAATSTKEFGDRIVLAGDSRALETVTISLTSWACENGAWNNLDCESSEGSTFAHPITVNLYETTGTDVVGDLIATKTQAVNALYRPSADNTNCTGGNAGKWYDTASSTCYNGIAFDTTFDFSEQGKYLTDEVIATVAYNTSNYGAAPIGVSGPYDSLNVSLVSDSPTIGTDYDGDVMYWDTTYPGYTAGLKADTGWPYHLGIEINADLLAGPTLLTPVDGESFKTSDLPATQSWTAVPGTTQYLYESYTQDPLVDDTPFYSQFRNTTSRTIGATAPEGHYWWRVKAVAPNTSEWSEARTFFVDNTAPNAPVNGQPATTTTNDFYFTWDAVTDSGSPIVEYQFQASTSSSSAGGVLNSGVWKNWESGNPEQSFLGTPTIHSIGAPDATWYWQVRAIDSAGNVGAWSSVWSSLIDTTAPTTPVITNPSDEQYFKTTPILNKWSASTDANGILKYQIEYIYDDGHTFSGGPYREVNGSTTQRNHVPSTGEQGGVTIRVRAFDTLGNTSAWSEPVHYYYDATPPTSDDDLAALVNGTVTITQTISDNIAAKNGKLRIWKVVGGTPDNSQFHAIGDINVNGDDEIEYVLDTVNDLYGDGEYLAKFTARDMAGHEIVTEKTFFVDNTAPDTTIAGSTQSTNTPTITGTVDDIDATVTLTVVGVGTFAPTPDALGNWSQTVGPLADGAYDIEVFATDQVGNVGTTNIALLTVNTVPAVVTDGDEDGDVEGVTDEDGEEGEPIANITPIITPPSSNGDQDVQGATDENDQGVEGTNTENTAQVDTDGSDGSIFGLAWYWWILILAGLAALIWGIVAALRRRQEA